MNKLLFLLSFLFVTLISNQASAFDIDITLTSADGCKFHIVGDVSISWGSFQGFTGTVTASGGGDCPNGTWTFGMAVVNNGGSGSGDFNSYRFSGESPLIDILRNEPETLTELINLFESQSE